MKQAFATLCAVFALLFIYSTLSSGPTSRAQAPAASATPDPFMVQLTSSPLGGGLTIFASEATDISADGRFVAIISNGDIATERTAARNNADGNRELFVMDYAQRRIFQITNTQNVPNPPASPTPTPTPSPTPTPTASPTPTPSPVPTPEDRTTVKIAISSNRPMISLQPTLTAGKRTYTIVFSSNAPNPASFDGTDPGGVLAADGNQEIWTYQMPAVADADLTSGADLPLLDLSAGTFTQVTNTPASRPPIPGVPNTSIASEADDNREATISDDGKIIAFISTRSDNLIHTGDTDGAPEVFLFNRTSSAFTQVTHTASTVNNGVLFSPLTQNPCLSSDGSVFAFISNANLTGDNNDDTKGNGNAEVFVANYNGSAVSNLRQLTKTKNDATQSTVNLFNFGRRLSRDGTLLAFDSLADDPKGNATTNNAFYAVFVCTISTSTFTQVGLRAIPPTGDFGFIHYPTFTDYDALLNPSTLVFGSALNFLPDGTFPAEADDAKGLNVDRQSQLFATQAHATSTNTFTRLTNDAVGTGLGFIRALPSNNRRRTAFTFLGDLTGGNNDGSTEVFYLIEPPGTDSNGTLTFFTGASAFPVPTATPTPTPSASPTPSPTPSPSPSPSASPTPATMAQGLAAGELTIVQGSVPLAPANTTATGGSETKRTPALPVELNGVSVSVNGVAAGLYFVGNAPSQINFVIPPGLLASTTDPAAVVVNNNGSVTRGLVQLITAQPDLFFTTTGSGNRAVVFNVTNPLVRTTEPFSVTSDDGTGTQVPTVLEISLTGVRGSLPASVIVTIGTTDITGAVTFIGPNPEMPGFDLIRVTLPATLAGAGDVPIVVTISPGLGTFSSRPAATAPHITISP